MQKSVRQSYILGGIICIARKEIEIADTLINKIHINVKNVLKRTCRNILLLVRIADIVGMIAINELKIKGKCDLAKILSGVK